MIQGLNVLLASIAALWLSACGGGGGGAKEEETTNGTNDSTTDATGQTSTTATGTAKVNGSVAKGESSQVEVDKASTRGESSSPSLTLSRLGENKLTWNEVVKAGASYLVFERTDAVKYDFTSPMQSLEDVVSLALTEKPGTHCYIIRAKTKDNKISVDSNEICITAAPALAFDPLSPSTLIATETLVLNLKAAAGPDSAIFSCTAHCPDGLTLDRNSGAVSWTPRLDQAGDHKFTFKAEVGKQSLEQEVTISVREAFINLTLSSEGQTIKALAQSNVQGTPTLAITQTAGPALTLNGQGGNWSWTAPDVRTPTDFGFEVTATLGALSRKASTTITVLPKDRGPSLEPYAGQSVIATETLHLGSVGADPDHDPLSFACILNCPQGFTIDATSGAMTWQPSLDQVGDAHPTIRVSANGQSASATLSIQVQAPSLQFNPAPLSAVSGESVSIKPDFQSNLQGPYQYSLTQSSGTLVSISGSNGRWSFTAPTVDDRQTLGFKLKIGNGRYTTEQNLSVQIDPRPVAPTVDVGTDRLTHGPIDVSATVSSNAKTLEWSLIQGPGRATFSAAHQANTQVSADADGVYLIQLAATNSSGQVGTASFHLTWDTTAPQLEVGADARSAQALTRTATVQGAKTLSWAKRSGPGNLTFSSSGTAATTISADQDGDYVIQLTAEDEAGNSAQDSFAWHYDHTPPTLSLGSAILMQTKTKTLTATVSDDTVAIKWKKVSGPSTLVFAPDNQKNTTVTLGGDGVYGVEASAADELGNTATAQQQITVDTLPPQISVITMGSIVADGFLNSFEKTQTLPLIQSVSISDSSAYTLAYKIVASTTSCTSSLVYAASIPSANDAAISKAGTFKICVKATDSFNLSAYAASPTFVYDATIISVTVTTLPLDPSRTTQLQAVVGGKSITHYKSKLGPVDITSCASSANYSTEAPVATPITTDYAAAVDGLMRLCVIGRTAAGNWQDLSVAYRYDWTLDRVVPEDTANLNVTPLVSRVRLSWDAAKNADFYLVVRSDDKAVSWSPNSGTVYNLGDDIDSGSHTIVAVTSGPQAFDETAVGGHNYSYALFAFDKALNYSLNPARARSTPIEPLDFNKANGFDRLVRVVLPIHEGEHKGKILVGGDFVVYQKDPAIRLLRMNADYTLDTSFKPAVINSSVYSIALADDGSVYIGGSFTTVGGKARARIARLTSTGALDESFAPGGFNNTVMALALNNDQTRIYAGGSFTSVTSIPAVTQNRLAALRTIDGSLDSNFVQKVSADQTKAGFNSTVWTILPDQGSSEIYVGGQFTDYGGVTLARLVKLDETGEIDPTISLGSGFDNTVVNLKMDSRQRLYVGGSFGKYRGSSYYARFVRLKSDGMPDTDFSKGLSTSPRFNATVYGIELDEANNRVYVSGDFTAYGSSTLTRLARLSMADGALDTSWTAGANGSLQTLGLAENGDLVGGGNFGRYGGDSTPFFFAATTQAGALNDKSPRGSVFNSNVFAAQRVDNQTFLAGSFTTYNGDTANRVVRLDRLGNIDRTFNSQVTNGSVYAIAWDETEKKLYIGGTFTQVNAVARNRIARLNADGSLDTGFVPEGVDSDVYAIALTHLPTTRSRVVYIGGKFTKIGTTPVGRIVRLLADGKTDSSFSTGSGFDSNVNAFALINAAEDHSLYVGGAFTKYNSLVANASRIIKLASDGSIASGFEAGGGFNGSVQTLLWMQAEGALYVGGAFTRYQSTIVANRIAKLDNTGGVPAGFNGTGFNSTVFALDFDGDNDVIWAGGAFTTFRSVAQGRIAAMARDGSRIAAMNAAVGFNSDVRALSSSFWGVVAAGLGSSYEGDVCGFAARLHVNASMD